MDKVNLLENVQDCIGFVIATLTEKIDQAKQKGLAVADLVNERQLAMRQRDELHASDQPALEATLQRYETRWKELATR